MNTNKIPKRMRMCTVYQLIPEVYKEDPEKVVDHRRGMVKVGFIVYSKIFFSFELSSDQINEKNSDINSAATQRAWKRPASASESERKLAENRRLNQAFSGSDGEKDRR